MEGVDMMNERQGPWYPKVQEVKQAVNKTLRHIRGQCGSI